MNMLLSLPQHLRVNYFANSVLLSEKWRKVYGGSTSSQCKASTTFVSFHETESSQTFLKHAIPDFADKLFFVSFQQNKPTGLLSNTAYEYALYSAFQLKTQKIDKDKILSFLVKKLVALLISRRSCQTKNKKLKYRSTARDQTIRFRWSMHFILRYLIGSHARKLVTERYGYYSTSNM